MFSFSPLGMGVNLGERAEPCLPAVCEQDGGSQAAGGPGEVGEEQ